MNRKPEYKDKRYTRADHRPMVPELRGPGDPLETALRELRRRYDDVIHDQKVKWR